MTSSISRLYREIDRSLPDARPYDTTYVRERKEIFELLQPMQYDKHVKSLSTRIEPVKHHGRLARLRGEQTQRRDTEAARMKELKDRMQENHTRAILQEYRDNDEVIHAMQKCVEKQTAIPARTVKQLFATDSRKYDIKNLILKGELDSVKELVSTTNSTIATGSNTNSPPRKLPPLDKSSLSSQNQPAVRPMPCFQQPTILVDNRRSFDRTKTHTKWSPEERQKLNDLYREIPVPSPSARPEIWSIYFDKVTERFHVFFSTRPKQEIRDKLKTMITRRQMKEAGEELFWEQQQGKLAHRHPTL